MARILIVDSDTQATGQMQAGLAKAGYEVATAATWDEVQLRIAERKHRFQPFDLALLSTQLPEMSGFEMAAAMRDLLYPFPPVVFIAAKKTIEAAVQASDIGARMLLIKPVLLPDLLDLVDQILAKKAGP